MNPVASGKSSGRQHIPQPMSPVMISFTDLFVIMHCSNKVFLCILNLEVMFKVKGIYENR